MNFFYTRLRPTCSGDTVLLLGPLASIGGCEIRILSQGTWTVDWLYSARYILVRERRQRVAQFRSPAQYPTKSIFVLDSGVSKSCVHNLLIHWTDGDKLKIYDLRNAGKEWRKISSLHHEDHTVLECRSYWIEQCWENSHNLIVEGEVDIEELERQGWKAEA